MAADGHALRLERQVIVIVKTSHEEEENKTDIPKTYERCLSGGEASRWEHGQRLNQQANSTA